jgi:predicted ATP-dependent serine protease
MTDVRVASWVHEGSGDRALDKLLGGGWVRPSAALVWGRPKSGKSRCVYRWASHCGPALVVPLEMSRDLTIATAREAGADLSRLHLLEDPNGSPVLKSAEGWSDEAVRMHARAVVFDSLSVATAYPVAMLRAAYEWAQNNRGIVFAIVHVNKRGSPNGPSALEHWPDYPVRVARSKRVGFSVVSLPQGSRFCAPGSVTLPIV